MAAETTLTLDAQRALDVAQTEKLLRGVLIPPRPALLVAVLEEQGRPEPDLERIARLISEDVALAASTLKLVNSPLFGLARPVVDIQHAVRMLGLRNITSLITGLLLHQAFRNQRGAFMERFWRKAERMAYTTALIARWCARVASEEAYALGLFCDCGVPLLLQQFPAYPGIYAAAEREAHTRPFIEVEHERLGTDHAAAGFLLARSWKLPADLCQAILRHHDAIDYYQREAPDPTVDKLALLLTAQHVLRLYAEQPPAAEWQTVGASVLAYLGIEEAALFQLIRLLRESNEKA
ncbi:HDOD domain-containing protein [Rhodothermus profundi]|uniref:HD-like signal output (HDOD) domain, no enzymatic activity n=1 Tax=Rhodothermus profundi TaxID=633813 RepID=A0A1M6P6H9_9BACT|nr:HDOD domain-containing protein [Rhodothermus profundi]SHK03496.1 HD-like signal output (HDOD) domain, no enzymatic activity [Rhodothermus profundi]